MAGAVTGAVAVVAAGGGSEAASGAANPNPNPNPNQASGAARLVRRWPLLCCRRLSNLVVAVALLAPVLGVIPRAIPERDPTALLDAVRATVVARLTVGPG